MPPAVKEPIFIFYHVCAIHHYASVVTEQLTALLYSGLLVHRDLMAVYCFVTGNTPDDVANAKRLLTSFSPKIQIVAESLDTRTFERFTLENIRPMVDEVRDEAGSENIRLLYIHSKGVSHTDPEKASNTTHWTRALNYHLIGRHEQCLALLRHYDVVGAFYSPTPAPHFQGNFWWTRMSYAKKLPERIGAGYLEPELNFLFQASPLWFNMATVPSAVRDLYKDALTPHYYTSVDNEPPIVEVAVALAAATATRDESSAEDEAGDEATAS